MFVRLLTLVSLLLSARAWAQTGYGLNLDPNKYTLCTVTINSTEERDEFQTHLPNKDFNQVELTNLNGTQYDRANWLDYACRSGISCDVLVFSGHFAGGFISMGGVGLRLERLNEHACAQDCGGILKNPKEVFLFGCNTLSDTEITDRSPEKYLNVLLEHHYEASRSVEVIDLRHGSGTLIQMMKNLFAGSLHLYGMQGMGPTGDHIKPYLQDYFQRIPDYKQHLQQEEQKRINLQLGKINENQMNNDVLTQTLGYTTFRQCLAADEKDPEQQAFRTNVCLLSSSSVPVNQKLGLIRDLVKAGSLKKYQFYIHKYLNEMAEADLTTPEAKAIFDEISQLEPMKTDFQVAFNNQPSITVRTDWVDLGKRFEWLDQTTVDQTKLAFLRTQMGEQKWQHSFEMICKHAEATSGIDLQYNEIPSDFWNEPQGVRIPPGDGIRAIGCFRSGDPQIAKQLLVNVSNNNYNPSYSQAATEALIKTCKRPAAKISLQTRTNFDDSELPATLADDPQGLEILDCLLPSGPALQKKIFQNAVDPAQPATLAEGSFKVLTDVCLQNKLKLEKMDPAVFEDLMNRSPAKDFLECLTMNNEETQKQLLTFFKDKYNDYGPFAVNAFTKACEAGKLSKDLKFDAKVLPKGFVEDDQNIDFIRCIKPKDVKIRKQVLKAVNQGLRDPELRDAQADLLDALEPISPVEMTQLVALTRDKSKKFQEGRKILLNFLVNNYADDKQVWGQVGQVLLNDKNPELKKEILESLSEQEEISGDKRFLKILKQLKKVERNREIKTMVQGLLDELKEAEAIKKP